MQFGACCPSTKSFLVPKRNKSVKFYTKDCFDGSEALVGCINIPFSNDDSHITLRVDTNKTLIVVCGNVEVRRIEHVY